MRLIFRMAVLGGCLLVTSIATAGANEPQKATATYGHYYYYTDGTVLIKEAESDWIESDGGSGEYDYMVGGIRFCSAKSGMICVVQGGEEDFAVPRKTLAVDDSWTFNGYLYKVLPCLTTMAPGGLPVDTQPMIKMRILGIDVSFYVIAKMGSGGKYPVYLFYFSPERGLIGRALPAEGEPIHVPLLQEAYGPGSPQFDSKISPNALLSEEDFKRLQNAPLLKRELPKKHK